MSIVLDRREPADPRLRQVREHLSRPWVQSSLAKWFIIGSLMLIDGLWIYLKGFHVVTADAAGILILVGLTSAIAWGYLFLFNNVGAFVFGDTVAFVVSFAVCGSVLSYLAISANFPLVDHCLSAADYAIGFDWPSYYLWIRDRPVIGRTLYFAYLCWAPEWVAIPLLLAFRQEYRVRELTSLGVISALGTMVISGLLPAVSAFPYYYPDPGMQLAWVKDIWGLRDGSLTSIDLRHLDGLVSMPSFHTIGAILFMYVLRGRKVLFPIGVALNGTIIVSTLSAGSHYLIDVLAGAVVAGLSIAVYCYWRWAASGQDGRSVIPSWIGRWAAACAAIEAARPRRQ